MKQEVILLIWDRMGDYHRARWDSLSKIMGHQSVIAADLGTSDHLYKWNNTIQKDGYILLSDKPVAKFDLFSRIKNFISALKLKNVSSVCIPGYGRLEYLLFIIIAKGLKRKVIIFAESWYGANKLKNYVKSMFLNTFCDFIFASGKKANSHFIDTLKVPSKKVMTGYSVVDNDHFNLKQSVCDSKPHLLCVARFSKEKNLIRLIRAFNRSKIRSEYILKMVGEGKLKSEMEKIAEENPNIIISNWVSYKELPEVYKKACLFILPSVFEPWGLVINEAMASGLPIIASHQCGCVPDLISEDNGFVFDAENEDELVVLLDQIAEIPKEKLKVMGKTSQEKISFYSPKAWAMTLSENIKNLR